MKHILALDQGTTSSRAILFNEEGSVVQIAQKEFTQFYPKAGWVEHDANEIWTTQREVALQALADARLNPSQVAAIGITNQRETTVVWDRDSGQPICNAIVWQDRRTADFCGVLKRKAYERTIQKRTGLLLDPYFSATKLNWILKNVPGARPKAASGRLAFGTIDSWLIWKLTAGKAHVTDPSNASRTMLFNLREGSWDESLLKLFDVPARILPEVRDSSGFVAEASGDFAGIPIAGIAGDQQAALFGQACIRPGIVKNTYGTGCFMLMNTGPRPVISRRKLLSTVAWRINGRTEYALEGSVFIGGAVVHWLRDGLGIIKSSKESETLASSVPDSGGIYLVPAFAGLGAPHWDPYARGLIIGITRGTNARHIARAALESIAYQSADLVDAMQSDAGIRLKELRVDGGASLNNLLMQVQADLLGVPVVRPRIAETTALGAAYLAGLAVGIWKSAEEVASHWQVESVFKPAMAASARKKARAGWTAAVKRASKWETD
jgi:glycerol kinase